MEVRTVPERKDFEVTWVNSSVLQEKILKSREGKRDEQNHSRLRGLEHGKSLWNPKIASL